MRHLQIIILPNMNTKSRNNKDVRRRSALSFVGGDGSLDVDHVLQSEPWRNIEKFEKSEAAYIQNILNDFGKTITQNNPNEAKEKLLKMAKDNIPAKKTPRSTKKTKSPIKNSSTDLFGASSSTNNNVIETNTTINKNKSLKSQSLFETSETVKETIPQEFPHDTDDVNEEIQNSLKASDKENVDLSKKIIKKKILQDMTNITKINLHTSTPKKVEKTLKKKESIAENKKPKTKNSENKSEKNIQRKEKQKKSKNTKKQIISSANILEEEKKINVNLENNLDEIISQELPHDTDNVRKETKKFSKARVKNINSNIKIKKEIEQDIANITEECLEAHTSTSKTEISKIIKKPAKKESMAKNKKQKNPENSEKKSEKNVQRRTIKKELKKEQAESSINVLEKDKKMNLSLENNLEYNKVNQNSSEDKKAKYKSMLNQLKRKNVKKENPKNKLQKDIQSSKSLKSSRINNTENTKCQCEKSSEKCSDNQCSLKAKEDYEKKEQRKKNLKAARAIEDLSRRITVVKRKMDCIKNDLKSNKSLDLDNNFIEDPSCSSQSTYSSSYFSDSSYSYSSCSCSSSCSCYDTSEYSSVFSTSSGTSESDSETQTSSEIEN